MPIRFGEGSDEVRRRIIEDPEAYFIENGLDGLRELVRAKGDKVREEIRTELWVNKLVGNAPDQMSGRPSASTGTSASAWLNLSDATIFQVVMELRNDVDYSEWVRFPGDDEGQCAKDSEAAFRAAVNDLQVEVVDYVKDFFSSP